MHVSGNTDGQLHWLTDNGQVLGRGFLCPAIDGEYALAALSGGGEKEESNRIEREHLTRRRQSPVSS